MEKMASVQEARDGRRPSALPVLTVRCQISCHEFGKEVCIRVVKFPIHGNEIAVVKLFVMHRAIFEFSKLWQDEQISS